MADIQKIAEDLIKLTSEEVADLVRVLKEEYDITPNTSSITPVRQLFDFRSWRGNDFSSFRQRKFCNSRTTQRKK